MGGFAASGGAPTQGSLDQPSEFQEDILWDLEYDYYSISSDSGPSINFNGGDGDLTMAFSEPSIKNEAGFDEFSLDGRFWPGYTRIPGLTMLAQNSHLPISDPSQSHEVSSSYSLYQSENSVFEAPTPPINYTTLNTDTRAYHSPTSDVFSITLPQAPFATVVAPLPTSPVRCKRESSSVSSTSTVDGGGRITKPKQRVIKHHPNGGKAPTTPHQQKLRSLIDASATGVYQAHIASAEAAAADQAELMRMFRLAPKLCTNPSSDSTFPVRDADKREYVRNMYDAIWDWSDYVEMGKTLGSASISASQPVPSRAEQQKKVLSNPLNDYVVEQLCWRLLNFAENAQQGIPTVDFWAGADGAWESYATFGDRVAAIGDSLRSSKQLVKSLLTAGDRWCARIANNPRGEYTHKVNNMKVNQRKNERLREATSARRKKEEEEEE
ncbi:hypothetical protein HC256_006126 [Beauveria bassiana]|nr:hypothetical protein HC256_006126 [Beauveria bassiana]